MYLAVDNQDLYGIEYIKLAAATAVKACDGQEEQLLTMIATDRALFVGIDVATPTKAIDVKQLLKSLQDDVTYLKRISRIEEREGINCKLAIKSGIQPHITYYSYHFSAVPSIFYLCVAVVQRDY